MPPQYCAERDSGQPRCDGPTTRRRSLADGYVSRRQGPACEEKPVLERARCLVTCMQLHETKESERRTLQMTDKKTKKCAHIPCMCDVEPGQEYCGDACGMPEAKMSRSRANAATRPARLRYKRQRPSRLRRLRCACWPFLFRTMARRMHSQSHESWNHWSGRGWLLVFALADDARLRTGNRSSE
jgi:hypothetical protein